MYYALRMQCENLSKERKILLGFRISAINLVAVYLFSIQVASLAWIIKNDFNL